MESDRHIKVQDLCGRRQGVAVKIVVHGPARLELLNFSHCIILGISDFTVTSKTT